MKRVCILTSLVLSILTYSGSGHCDDKGQKELTDKPYFGEKPPGLTPKLFDPKIVSPNGRLEGGTFTPDGKTFYFSRKDADYRKRTFYVIRHENGKWGKATETNIRWPQFTADGNTMFGGKWYRERTKNGWSDIKTRGDFLKEQAHGLTISNNGTFYFPFFKKEDNGHGNIGYSRRINGKNELPVKMGPEINRGEWIAHPYVAPDESYLMWDVVRDDGYGNSDIYISFRDKTGNWLPAINMGNKINSDMNDSSPRVTHDGKYLFFSRGDWYRQDDGTRKWKGKSYWVDAKIIETLRPKS
ncbi:hypothetical protein ACFSJY_10270 [Thalassotalea euphylliae]|uniref:hypothetical protein n=1 Tax=Thalassotalea euphylliae TaxID=1655234 RepID=UPI00363B17F0